MIKKGFNIYPCRSWKVRKISIFNLPKLVVVENVFPKRCVAIGVASSGTSLGYTCAKANNTCPMPLNCVVDVSALLG